jgi:hypothetical protein
VVFTFFLDGWKESGIYVVFALTFAFNKRKLAPSRFQTTNSWICSTSTHVLETRLRFCLVRISQALPKRDGDKGIVQDGAFMPVFSEMIQAAVSGVIWRNLPKSLKVYMSTSRFTFIHLSRIGNFHCEHISVLNIMIP